MERALAIDPNCAEAYFARGNIFRQVVGDWTAAKSDYERAVTLDPNGEIGERAQIYQLYEATFERQLRQSYRRTAPGIWSEIRWIRIPYHYLA